MDVYRGEIYAERNFLRYKLLLLRVNQVLLFVLVKRLPKHYMLILILIMMQFMYTREKNIEGVSFIIVLILIHLVAPLVVLLIPNCF